MAAKIAKGTQPQEVLRFLRFFAAINPGSSVGKGIMAIARLGRRISMANDQFSMTKLNQRLQVLMRSETALLQSLAPISTY
jgi:hypothetical protein